MSGPGPTAPNWPGPVAILVPVLRRPHRVRPLLDSIAAATSARANVHFICDPDDTAEQEAVEVARQQVALEVHGHRHGGSYARKINAGVSLTDEPLLFVGADDLLFHPGWFEAAARLLGPTVGVVGTNDLGNPRVVAGQHATHILVARWYAELGTIDEPGKLLHDGYAHNYCDTELVEIAKARRAWAFAADSIVEHLHPLWGKAESDEVYAKGQATFRQDGDLYRRRQRLWA